MDEIHIRGLDVFAHHGVFPEETRLGQHFIVNAVLYTNIRRAGLTDALEQTTDYGAVCQEITRYLQEHTWKLLEAAAEHTAQHLLQQFPLLSAVDLELEKPQAPIGLPFDTVSVKIHRAWRRAYVALGSNLGDQRGDIQGALEGLRQNPQIRVGRCSTLIATAPYGGVEQDDFLNGAVELDTLLTPWELLDELHRLERAAGRERKVHWGPRTLDLDILLYDSEIIRSRDLTIPHPDMPNRAFVLEPMAEIAPDVLHPVLHRTMAELLDELRGREPC
ncbi:MAG: 2-amino-4-hydroxy-6-hydroxymethyldihydropteridine diphosphokinase [Clostridiales bacterium]|nr:2-amino-4-hydroxy-6-hydroxymethyldihydropteridine diphosphokinase [Clostridiales bacterium]